MELVLAKNPDPDSKLPYLLQVPIDSGLVFRCRDTWPRTSAVYCHPVDADEWFEGVEIIERIALRSCARRGSAIDIIADRSRENRSQIVFTTARGREMVFWQSPKTRKQSRPNASRPSGAASGKADFTIVVDANERYAYKFSAMDVSIEKRRLACGDYAVFDNDNLLGVVERKSLEDLSGAILGGRLKYQMMELATVPRAAVVVENGYPELFKVSFGSPTTVANGIAELQVSFPNVPIIFCGTRKFAEEWTYRFLAAARVWTPEVS